MEQYIPKSALVTEIERLREKLQDKVETSDFIAGEVFIINYFLTFIDSLQEEPVSEELEEAANDFAEGEWDGLHDNDGNALYDQDYVEYAFKAGAQWQKEQMMKDNSKC